MASTPFLPPPGLGSVPPPTPGATTSAPTKAQNGHPEPAPVVTSGGPGHRSSTFDARQIALLQLCFDESELAGGIVQDGTTTEGGPAGGGPDGGLDALQSAPSSFDAAQFVREKCTHVSLSTLLRDLEFYAKDVDERVMKRIHEDVHESFIDVSGQLVGMQDQLQQVLAPLDDVSHRVKHATEGLQLREKMVDGLCSEIQGHEMERQFNAKLLELLLTQEALNVHLDETDACLATLQDLRASSGGGGAAALNTTVSDLVHSLHRSAIDVQRLESLTNGGDSSLVVPPLHVMIKIHQNDTVEHGSGSRKHQAAPSAAEGQQRVRLLVEGLEQEAAEALTGAQEAIASFYSALDHAFVLCYGVVFGRNAISGTQQGDRDLAEITMSVEALLRIYKLLGEEDRCCEQYSAAVVKPLVEDALPWAAKSDSGSSKTEQLLTSLQQRLETEVLSFLPTFRRALLGESDPTGQASSSTANRISLVSLAVWPAVLDTITKRMQYLFSPGIPATFHRHFLLSQNLVSALESHCVDLVELSQLRASSNMTYWKSRWNVDVYHNMLQAEMMKRLRASFEQPLAVAGSSSSSWSLEPALEAAAGGKAHFQSTVDFCSAAAWYFSTDRILFPLVTRFVRDVVGSSLHLYTSAIIKSVTASTSDRGNAGGGLDVACKALQDFHHVQVFLGQHWVGLFQRAMASEDDPNVQATAAQLTKYVSGQVTKQATAILTHLVVHLTAACETTHLTKISKTIKGKYWATKKPCPTQGSDFMRDCLKASVGFKDLVEGMPGGGSFLLPIAGASSSEGTDVQGGINSFFQEVAAACCEKLLSHCKKTMLEAKKVQEMAQRKAGGQEAPSVSAVPPSQEAMTDSDKMAVQVYRDIESFGDQLGALGITKETFAPFKDVQGKVGAKGKWLLGGLPPGTAMPPDVAVEDE